MVVYTTVDGTNPSWPNRYYTTSIPTVSVYRVLQDFYHQQYLWLLASRVQGFALGVFDGRGLDGLQCLGLKCEVFML